MRRREDGDAGVEPEEPDEVGWVRAAWSVRVQAQRLTHLHVTRRDKALTIASGPEDDPEPEARLTLLAGGAWRLDLRHHTGRREQTPFTGAMVDLVDTAAAMGRLADFGPPGPWNRGDTSVPPH